LNKGNEDRTGPVK
jgi:hypothetical protein